jgi:hypothetical protein
MWKNGPLQDHKKKKKIYIYIYILFATGGNRIMSNDNPFQGHNTVLCHNRKNKNLVTATKKQYCVWPWKCSFSCTSFLLDWAPFPPLHPWLWVSAFLATWVYNPIRKTTSKPYTLAYIPQLSLIQLSPSWEAINCAVTPSILWNLEVYYHVHKSFPLVSILSQSNPVHTTSSYHSTMQFNIVHPPTSWSS